MTTEKPLGWILRSLFSFFLFDRTERPELMYWPYIMLFYYTKKDREFLKNCKTVRNFCEALVNERRKMDSSSNQEKDMLSILINDDSFKGRDSEIIDECITFFLAGSQTTKVANTNLLIYFTMNEKVETKLLAEINSLFNLKERHGDFDVVTIFEYEKVMDLKYY